MTLRREHEVVPRRTCMLQKLGGRSFAIDVQPGDVVRDRTTGWTGVVVGLIADPGQARPNRAEVEVVRCQTSGPFLAGRICPLLCNLEPVP